MSQTCLVVCRDCNGTGRKPDREWEDCGECMGMRRVAVDKTPDGLPPVGWTEWVDHLLPELPKPQD